MRKLFAGIYAFLCLLGVITIGILIQQYPVPLLMIFSLVGLVLVWWNFYLIFEDIT